MRKPSVDLIAVLLVGAVLATLMVLAVYLVNRESAATVADQAESSILAEATLSASAAIRNATNTVVVLTGQGVADDLVSEAISEVESTASELGARTRSLIQAVDSEQAPTIESAETALEESTTAVLQAVSRNAGDEEIASALSAQAEAYDTMTMEVVSIRDGNLQDVLVAGRGVGRVAEAVRFLVVFLIPLGLIVGFWRAQKKATLRRRLTEEVQRHRAESRAKDQFVADVSHELRTPLTGIYGFASALEDDAESLPDQARELVGLIVTEAAELSRMVDDLVAAGRIDAGAITYSIEVVDVGEEMEEVLKPLRRRGIDIEFEPVAVSVMADRLRLRQLLRNLLSNAAKYGGPNIAVAVWVKREDVHIEILDDGPGVSPEVEDRLFRRYVHEGGTALLEGSVGLGLAIARSFAVDMGGSLNYTRADGITVFQVVLPLADTDRTAPHLSALTAGP